MHIMERTVTTVWAMVGIHSLRKLSMETAIKLYDLKTVLILTYYLAMTELSHLLTVVIMTLTTTVQVTINPSLVSHCTVV